MNILVFAENSVLLKQRLISCQAFSAAHIVVLTQGESLEKRLADSIIAEHMPSAKKLHLMHAPQGPACAALLAAATIDSSEELLILSGTEHSKDPLALMVEGFRSHQWKAGVALMPTTSASSSSYVRINANGCVVEASSSVPISDMAVAGVYWFAHGHDFVRAAKKMIRKDASMGGIFFIAPALNELILERFQIGTHPYKTHKRESSAA